MLQRQKRRSLPILWLALTFLAGGLLLRPGFEQPIPAFAAQSTRDSLPTRTMTPRPLATSNPQASLTPTPAPKVWVGRLVSNTLGYTKGSGSIFRVIVEGKVGTKIELRSGNVFITAESGTKPEYGPYTAEFAPVTAGDWIVSVPELGVSMHMVADNYNLAVIEFVQIPVPDATQAALPTATPTPTDTLTPLPPTVTNTPAPPTHTPLPTNTAIPTETPSPTVTPLPPPTATSLPSPTPVTRWLGVILGRTQTETEAAAIVVKVAGIEGLPVQLRAAGINVGGERRCITGQGITGPDSCTFENLKSGQYFVAPEGLGLSLPVTIFDNEQVEAVFDLEVLSPGVTGWEARLLKNENGFQATPNTEAIIRVRIAGRAGQVAALRSARGTEQFCEVASNPILGGLVCEFGRLAPGVYLVEALNTGTGLRLFVDGSSTAEVEFSPSATYATLALAQSPPVVGQGAQPRRTPTATIEASPTSVTVIIRPSATATATPRPTATPTPAFVWQGRIVETQNGVVGTIAVRAAGLKDHPVIIHSGPWQTPPQLTGTKPELGDYATEFGGLATGEYTIELVDLAEMRVNLGPGQFMLVEFRYGLVDSP